MNFMVNNMNRFTLETERNLEQQRSNTIEDLMNDISELYKTDNPDIIVIYGLISRTESLIKDLLKDSEKADIIKKVIILQNVSVLKTEQKRLNDYALVIKSKNKAESISNEINTTSSIIDFKKKLEDGI